MIVIWVGMKVLDSTTRATGVKMNAITVHKHVSAKAVSVKREHLPSAISELFLTYDHLFIVFFL